MNRPTLISLFSDQCRTKSTTRSRTSCGTQVALRVPQDFFLMRCAPPSAPPGPRPWFALSSPRTQSASVSPPPGGEGVRASGRRTLRSRRTLFASGRTPLAAVPVLHTGQIPQPCLKDGAVEWPPFPQQCSASVLFSYVRSAILTDERSLHFQLRRNTFPPLALPVARPQHSSSIPRSDRLPPWASSRLSGFLSVRCGRKPHSVSALRCRCHAIFL